MFPPPYDYDEICRAFRWQVPTFYNMAVDLCDRNAAATPDAPALVHEADCGGITRYSFGALREQSQRLANALAALGARRGDRIAVMLGQTPEALIAHLACWRSGLVSLPISPALDETTVGYRLRDGAAALAIADSATLPVLDRLRPTLPDLAQVVAVDAREPGTVDFSTLLAKASADHRAVATRADEPAFLAYTSGSTGPSKGVLHGHRTMLGHLPGYVLAYEFFGQPGDLCWTPADWAGGGGLTLSLLQCLWFGKPAVACRPAGPFDPERAYRTVIRHGVRNLFMMPTMLKQLRQARPPSGLGLRSFVSAGEPVGLSLYEWTRASLGVHVNEVYGQNECNFLLAHVPSLMPPRPGSLGRACPGYVVGVLDPEGREVGPGQEGELASRSPNPVHMLSYWQNPEATARKYVGDWLLTGDIVARDESGYVWFRGRPEDFVTIGGQRVGPGAIEDALLSHPAVAISAVVGEESDGVDDVLRAYVQVREGHVPTPALASDILMHLRARLDPDLVPASVEFVAAMPLTATNKVMRRALRERTGTS